MSFSIGDTLVIGIGRKIKRNNSMSGNYGFLLDFLLDLDFLIIFIIFFIRFFIRFFNIIVELIFVNELLLFNNVIKNSIM